MKQPPRLKHEIDLEWVFSYAEGDLGLESAHEALVAMAQSGAKHAGHSTGDGAERKMHSRIEAAARYRKLSAIINRLPVLTQRVLLGAFKVRQWSAELARRPVRYRMAACESKPVRARLGGTWEPKAAERLLVAAEKATGDDELVDLRKRVWAAAEAAVDAAVSAYVVAAAGAADEAADAKAERLRKVAGG